MLISVDESGMCGRTIAITHQNKQDLQDYRMGNYTMGISGLRRLFALFRSVSGAL